MGLQYFRIQDGPDVDAASECTHEMIGHPRNGSQSKSFRSSQCAQ